MKHLKTFEGFSEKFFKIFGHHSKPKIDEYDKTLLIISIFRSLEESGYKFKMLRSPSNKKSKVFKSRFDEINTMWLYELDELDGKPPIFRDLLNGSLEMLCDVEVFKIRPHLSIKGDYNKSHLMRDFPNIEFDPLNPDVVDEIMVFIDRFELKVLK
jgi:hypothetical protein